MFAFFWWLDNALLVSSRVRNHAPGYGLGAGAAGIICIHVILLPTLNQGNGFLKFINTIMGPTLVGLAFGTME